MPKFFVNEPIEECTVLSGETAAHIAKSLRMKPGEEVVLCDGKGYDYACVIESVSKSQVELKLAFKTPSESEPAVRVEIFQGLPKGDKMAEVVRKCTELGVSAFHPVVMQRSVMKLDQKSAEKKVARLKKIAAEAAGQARRGIVPEVYAVEPYEKALEKNTCEKTILFYENGGRPLKEILEVYSAQQVESLALIIGPEGGFESAEVDFAKAHGAEVATLGKRILRTETAPVAASANVFYELDK
ncbi:MAG: 16S rRNA (uracil(1498)-N(3))-methyltransferase [Clostridia bacterium]|nr:16S rRNA (uracil(1498)-N(3))-methyltransferase [Clostridia bacterium]